MATIPTRISPSPEARQLFGKMVARSTRCHIPLKETLELGLERHRAGIESDNDAVNELIVEEWIDAAPDGGWMLH